MSGRGGVVTRSQRLGRRSLDRSDDDGSDDQGRYPDSDDSGADNYACTRFDRSTASSVSISSREASIYDTSIASSRSHCSPRSTPVSPAGLSDRSVSSPGTPAYRRTVGAGIKNQSLLDSSIHKSSSPRSPAAPQGRLYPNLNQSCSSSLSPPSPRSRRPKNNSLYPDLTPEKSGTSSSPNTSHSQNSSHSQRSSNTWVYAIVCFAATVFLLLMLSGNSNKTDDANLTPFEIFVRDVSSLEAHFPGQARRTWKTVKATAKHVLSDTAPAYPSIVLIGASGAGHSRLASCITRHIAARFESSSTFIRGEVPQTTDVETYRHLSAAEQKMRLDRSFQKAFDTAEGDGNSRRSKSILVENLQMLSAEAALLLYKYCDGDNAPYKDVMILLTVDVWPPRSGDGGAVSVVDGAFVETYLADIWKRQIDGDKVDALMSRVANNVVVIEPETELVFRRECLTD